MAGTEKSTRNSYRNEEFNGKNVSDKEKYKKRKSVLDEEIKVEEEKKHRGNKKLTEKGKQIQGQRN